MGVSNSARLTVPGLVKPLVAVTVLTTGGVTVTFRPGPGVLKASVSGIVGDGLTNGGWITMGPWVYRPVLSTGVPELFEITKVGRRDAVPNGATWGHHRGLPNGP